MAFSFSKNKFCSPSFLSMSFSGVSVGDSFVRYIQFSSSNNNNLQSFGEIDLARGSMVGGEIKNKEDVVRALKELKKNIKSDFVKVSLPEEKVYIFSTKVPKVSNVEIRETLKFKIEENVPLKMEDAFFEYEPIDILNKFDENIWVSVYVVSKQVVESYLEVFNLAGLTPISFEVESKMSAVSVLAEDNKEAILILNVKDNSTILSVVLGQTVLFSTTFSVGNSLIIDSLLKAGVSQKDLLGKLTEKIVGFDNDDIQIADSLFNIFSIIKDEIGKFDDYLSLQRNNKNSVMVFLPEIKKIVLCGKVGAFPGFVNQINQDLDMKVGLANVWTNIYDLNSYLPGISFFDSLDYSVPVGLARPYKK